MIILTVKLKSALSYEAAVAASEERLPEYRSLPGLIQKYYAYDKETGEFTGVLIWESEEALRAFRASELSQTVGSFYQVTEPPHIQRFDVFTVLRPVESATPVS